MVFNTNRLTRICQEIMGELQHDCPGCLLEWQRQLTLREVELGYKLLAWQVTNDQEQIVHIYYGKSQTGKVFFQDDLYEPVHR